ncbi:hypothetical protein HispidOSU_004578, partial [Sigmodon hispidus]
INIAQCIHRITWALLQVESCSTEMQDNSMHIIRDHLLLCSPSGRKGLELE